MGAAYQAKHSLMQHKNNDCKNSFQTVINTVTPPKLACSPHKDAYEVNSKLKFLNKISNLLLLILDLYSNDRAV